MTATRTMEPEEYTRCVVCREILEIGEETNVDGFIPVCSEEHAEEV